MAFFRFLNLGLASIFLLFSVSCQQEKTLFKKITPKQSGITFENTIITNDSFNTITYEDIYNGGGVAVGDFNNDGLQDLFFTGNMVSSKLYINKGNLQFEDITEQAGVTTDRWCTGVSVFDINQDGFDDIYIAVAGYHDADKR
ncbi:MAG: FG-GAP repeat domain-containing protein, partial [Cyclobacteriaceae bacterium]